MELELLSKQYFLGVPKSVSLKVENTNIHDGTLNIDGYKHSMVQIISLIIALKSSVIIKNPPLVSDILFFLLFPVRQCTVPPLWKCRPEKRLSAHAYLLS